LSDRSIKLVCFDLGGVLIRICRSWEEGCAAAGLDVREGFRSPIHEPRRRAAVDALQRGAIEPDEFWVEISDCFGGVYEPYEIERVHRAWTLGEYEGVCDVIDRIHDAGVATACLSNTNAPHWEILVRHDALKRLHSLHASHLLRSAKPDEAIYRAFEQAVGRAGEEILFFEDTEENAVAAFALGWRTAVVDPHTETAPQIEAALLEHGVLHRS
jgi:putative hydrolase of the HAD superfamily